MMVKQLEFIISLFMLLILGNKRRGICPIQDLSAAGVNACYATNNVQNLFTFTGRFFDRLFL